MKARPSRWAIKPQEGKALGSDSRITLLPIPVPHLPVLWPMNRRRQVGMTRETVRSECIRFKKQDTVKRNEIPRCPVIKPSCALEGRTHFNLIKPDVSYPIDQSCCYRAFLSSKSSFSVIVETLRCQIWTGFDQNNCSHISRSTLSEAAQLYLILHRSCFTLRSDHQMIFTFTEWSSSHLLRSVSFFISQSALHYMFGSFTSHLTKTYYWRYWVIFRSFICQNLLHCYKDLIDLSYKHQNCIIEISNCTKLNVFE